MEKRNKYLIIIMVVLIVAIGISGFFLYQSYRMSQMDKLMLEHNDLSLKFSTKYSETNAIANTTPLDYDKLYSNMDELININNQEKAIAETAYQSADGPYKDMIGLYLKQDGLITNSVNLWKSRVEYIQQKNLFQENQIIKQEDDNTNELTKVSNDISTFKSTHLDVKEHVKKYWNFTDD